MENFIKSMKKKVDLQILKDYLIKKYNLELLVLFGSYVKGEFWQGSDFDIAFWSKQRLVKHELEKFILDIVLLSGFDKVNVIDLYFESQQRAEELKGLKYGRELSLLQYMIYTTGQLLYENEDGLFDKKRSEVIEYHKFKNKDVKKLIINDKLESIKKLGEELSRLTKYEYKEEIKGIPYNIREEMLLYLHSAKIKITLDIINIVVRLNRFVLNEYYNFNPVSSYESFTKLDMVKAFTQEDQDKIKSMAHIVAFNNFLTIDYYYGSAWSVGTTIEEVAVILHEYIHIMEKLF